MRLTVLFVSILSVCACGGSSSSGLEGAGDGAGQDLPPLARALQMLETCALSEVDGLVELVEFFQDASQPGAATPAFQITGFDIADASVSWVVDVDGDGPADVSGTLRFRDAAGNPTFPFDLTELLTGSFDLPSVLAAIQDGTVVVVEFRLLRGTDTTGTLNFTMQDGTPSPTSGSMFVNGADCQITITFDDLLSNQNPGTYPTGTADLLIVSQGSTLDGVITFNGTSTAVIDATLDGADSFTFTYDLATGDVTPVF